MSPPARASQESPSIAVPAKLPQPAPETFQESTLPKVLLSAENIALKQRLHKLELAEKRLTEQVNDANTQLANQKQRSIEAEKRATTAEIEMKAATARAQNRYTEKMHANNESRNLRIALEKEKAERASYFGRSKSVFQGLNDQIRELKAKYDGEVDTFQTAYLEALEESKKLKPINEKHKKDIEALTKINNDFRVTNAQLQRDLDAEKTKQKAAPDALTKDQVEARIVTVKADAVKEATITMQSKIAEARATIEEHAKKQLSAAIKSNQLHMQEQMKKQFDEAIKSARDRMQQHLLMKQNEWSTKEVELTKKAVDLEAKLETVNKAARSGQQGREAASCTVPDNSQRPGKRVQRISSQDMSDPNKRRRLNSVNATGINTPDFQRTYSNSFPSDATLMSPMLATNRDAMMFGTNMQGQAHIMTPNGTHRRNLSQQLNGPAGQMTPTRHSSQQYGASMAAPPNQQNGMPPSVQGYGNMSSQQRQYLVPSVAPGNTGIQSPMFDPYNSGMPHISPQVRQQMGHGPQITDQAGNLGSCNGQGYDERLLRQMQRQAQSQLQSRMPESMQGGMQPTRPYGSTPSMTTPQPRVAQVPSNCSAFLVAQYPNPSQNFEKQNGSNHNTNQEVEERYSPTMDDTEFIPPFDGDALMAETGAAYAGQPAMEDGYDGNDWFPTGNEQSQRHAAQNAVTPTFPSNGTPLLQETDFQQPQQRSHQNHTRDRLQVHESNPSDTAHGSEGVQNESTMNMNTNGSRQTSVSGRVTRATSRSIPAPSGQSRRKTPGPTEPNQVPCVNCYRHWWEHECDEAEPCSNCIASKTKCVRQKCVNYAAGTCDKGNKCPNVHEGDERYQNDELLVNQTKAGKRPPRIGHKSHATPAPSATQQP